MFKIFVIGAGGALGALARYGLSGWAQRLAPGTFPAGTLAVNLTGCLVIGVLMSLVENAQMFSPNTRLFLMIGFLGSLTTFSTVGYETFQFLRSGEPRLALLNAAANLLLGLLAVAAGWMGGQALAGQLGR
jgi:CrcB protein